MLTSTMFIAIHLLVMYKQDHFHCIIISTLQLKQNVVKKTDFINFIVKQISYYFGVCSVRLEKFYYLKLNKLGITCPEYL